MTNEQRLLSLLGFEPPANATEGALLDAGISPGDTYTGSLSVEIKKVAIQIMELLLTTADTKSGEPGFEIKYDRDAVLKRIKLIKDELEVTDETMPTITGKSVW